MNQPQVIINCAMSADGKIALPSRRQLQISCEEDMQRVYKLRHTCDAVLVGIGTVLADDPKLTVKERYVPDPRQPLRIVLDSKGRTPKEALVVNDKAQTMIVTATPCATSFGPHVEVLQGKVDKKGYIDLQSLLVMLHTRGIRTLLVEGGSTVIWNFLREQLVDDVFIYLGPLVVGGAHTPTMAGGEGIESEDKVIHLKLVDIERLGPGVLLHYKLDTP